MGLAAGVELEGGPVERLAEGFPRVEKGELGLAQGGTGLLFVLEILVQAPHQLWRGLIADFPECADDVVRSSVEKSPGEPHGAFPRIGSRAAPVARRDGDKPRVEGHLNDVASVELEGVFGCRRTGKDDGGIQRVGAAGHAMGNEVNEGELLRVAIEVGRRSCLLAGVDGFVLRCNGLSNLNHLGSSFGQLGIVDIRGDGIADEQKLAGRMF